MTEIRASRPLAAPLFRRTAVEPPSFRKATSG